MAFNPKWIRKTMSELWGAMRRTEPGAGHAAAPAERVDEYFSTRVATGARFKGRDELLDVVCGSVKDENIFLYGPNGSGKTSLALHACELMGVRPALARVPSGLGANALLSHLWAFAKGRNPGKSEVSGGLEVTAIRLSKKVEAADQVDTDTVARALAKRKALVVIDDLERLDMADAHVVADLLKKVHDQEDRSFGVVVIAATREPLSFLASAGGGRDESAMSRTRLCRVSPLAPSDMRAISETGFREFKVKMAERDYSRVHYHCCGLGRELHKICQAVARGVLAESDGDRRGNRFIFKALGQIGGTDTIESRKEALVRRVNSLENPDRAFGVAFVASQLPWEVLEIAALQRFCALAGIPEADGGTIEDLVSGGIFVRSDRTVGGGAVSFASFDDVLALRYLAPTASEHGASVEAMRDDPQWREQYKLLAGKNGQGWGEWSAGGVGLRE